ncbi:MAG: hypothetical protein KC635_29175 [Myxococcales bacterium]|nr:hypothetical protein [Myxococcales bacterium]MCB9735552.1 hypothetical protein [Deltaproteobacteria bacterium]
MARGPRLLPLAAALTLALVTLAPLAARAAAASDDEVRRVTREVLSDPEYQQAPKREAPRETTTRRTRPAGRGVRSGISPGKAPAAGGGDVAMVVLVIAGIALVLAIGGAVLGTFQRSRASRASRRLSPEIVAPEARAAAIDLLPASLAAARRLAAEGRYDEAVHALLRGAIDTVAVIGRLALTAAMTSREVQRGATLAPAEGTAFGDLVLAVERSLFGAEDVGPAEFEHCVDAFNLLEARLRG